MAQNVPPPPQLLRCGTHDAGHATAVRPLATNYTFPPPCPPENIGCHVQVSVLNVLGVLLARFNTKVELLRSAGSILLAAASPVSMQSIQDVFRLCA